MKTKDLIEILQEQDPESEVTIIAESFTEKADYHYTVLGVVGEGEVVYVETDYKD